MFCVVIYFIFGETEFAMTFWFAYADQLFAQRFSV